MPENEDGNGARPGPRRKARSARRPQPKRIAEPKRKPNAAARQQEPRIARIESEAIEVGPGGVVVGPEGTDPPDLSDTPFDGTTTGRGGTANRIDITYDPSKSENACPCERIRFIQTAQVFVDGNATDPGDLVTAMEERDNTALDDDPTTERDETGLHVDRLTGRREPYYGGNGAGTGASVVGTCNGTSRSATMQDTPFYHDSFFAPGGADSRQGNDWNANEIVVEFEACAFCESGERAGQFMECIKWTYRKTAADVAAGSNGRAELGETTSKPSKAFDKAVKRWIDTKNFDLPGAN
ncbi:MAG: hypothetical protein QNJ15_00900 [Erythrobacter sp.]|nr:hypothetical protein [Erythrobacter sp.]